MRERADHHDAELLLRLYELRREKRIREAREWIMRDFKADSAEDFAKRVPQGSAEHTSFRMVTSYWEMAASLVNRGLIDEDLFFENTTEFWVVWERVRRLAPATREMFKNPLFWKNLETVSEKFERWMNKRAPEALEAMRKMIVGRA